MKIVYISFRWIFPLQFRKSRNWWRKTTNARLRDTSARPWFDSGLSQCTRTCFDRFRHDCWWKDFSHFFGLGGFSLKDLQRNSQPWNPVFFTQTAQFFLELHCSRFFIFWGFLVLFFAMNCSIFIFLKILFFCVFT